MTPACALLLGGLGCLGAVVAISVLLVRHPSNGRLALAWLALLAVLEVEALLLVALRPAWTVWQGWRWVRHVLGAGP